jgi:CS domain
MPSSDTFRYVLIPADPQRPLEVRVESKAGGITDDALIAHARKYFADLQESASASSSTSAGDDASRRKQQLVQEIRQQLASSNQGDMSKQLLEKSDDDLYAMFGNKSSSCDITALTVPTERNSHTAVSMYSREDNAEGGEAALNVRATQLAASCGHVSTRIFGDAFVGRAKDDEAADVWERLDFTVEDADPSAEWCRVASSPGGGGGSGSAASSPASLSSLVGSAMGSNTAVVDASRGAAAAAASTDSMFGMNGASVVEPWGSWTQNRDEVELKFALQDPNVPSKQVKVNFARNHLKVTVVDQTVLEGTLFDNVHVDDCTYTLQTTTDGQRELCVTLSKAQEGRTWTWAVKLP